MSHGIDSICQQSLQSIVDCDPRLDIDVIHNPYPHESGEFLQFANRLVATGAVRSLTVFYKNISNNALYVSLRRNRALYLCSEYMLISDCDVVAPPGLIDEQINILSQHQDVLVCGLRVDASLWTDTLQVKSELIKRYNTPMFERESYVAAATGLWMLMVRTRDLFRILDVIDRNGLRLTDGIIKFLGQAILRKHWAATKKSMGRELNRERNDYRETKKISVSEFADHSPELSGSNWVTWNHDLIASAKMISRAGIQHLSFPPLQPAKPRFRGSITTDPVILEMKSGRLQLDSGQLVKLIPPNGKGLFFLISEAGPLTGIPYLEDKSVIHLSTSEVGGNRVELLSDIYIGSELLKRNPDQATRVLETLVSLLKPSGVIRGRIGVMQDSSEDTEIKNGWLVVHAAKRGYRLNFSQAAAAGNLWSFTLHA